jgi:hypothetical protein
VCNRFAQRTHLHLPSANCLGPNVVSSQARSWLLANSLVRPGPFSISGGGKAAAERLSSRAQSISGRKYIPEEAGSCCGMLPACPGDTAVFGLRVAGRSTCSVQGFRMCAATRRARSGGRKGGRQPSCENCLDKGN